MLHIMKEKRKLYNFRLSNLEARYLDDASEELGLNYSDTIRTLLRKFIRRKVLNDNRNKL